MSDISAWTNWIVSTVVPFVLIGAVLIMPTIYTTVLYKKVNELTPEKKDKTFEAMLSVTIGLVVLLIIYGYWIGSKITVFTNMAADVSNIGKILAGSSP